MVDSINIKARCVLCWRQLTTSIEAIKDGTASCPDCGSLTVSEHTDG